MKKTLAFLLSAIILVQMGIAAFAAFDAPNLSKEEWKVYYESLAQSNTLPTLNVGADETQVSLCWHSDKAAATPEVQVSENSDMSAATLFKGTTTDAENDTQLVCRVVITGLKENTTYYYRWNTGSGWSETEKYETKSFKDHKALVVGDIQIAEDSRPAGDLS